MISCGFLSWLLQSLVELKLEWRFGIQLTDLFNSFFKITRKKLVHMDYLDQDWSQSKVNINFKIFFYILMGLKVVFKKWKYLFWLILLLFLDFSELLSFGGNVNGIYMAGIWKFLSKSNSWVKIGDLPSAAYEVAAIPVKGIYCFNWVVATKPHIGTNFH